MATAVRKKPKCNENTVVGGYRSGTPFFFALPSSHFFYFILHSHWRPAASSIIQTQYAISLQHAMGTPCRGAYICVYALVFHFDCLVLCALGVCARFFLCNFFFFLVLAVLPSAHGSAILYLNVSFTYLYRSAKKLEAISWKSVSGQSHQTIYILLKWGNGVQHRRRNDSNHKLWNFEGRITSLCESGFDDWLKKKIWCEAIYLGVRGALFNAPKFFTFKKFIWKIVISIFGRNRPKIY